MPCLHLSVVASYWDGPENLSLRYSCTVWLLSYWIRAALVRPTGTAAADGVWVPELGHKRHGSIRRALMGRLLWRKPVPCREDTQAAVKMPTGRGAGPRLASRLAELPWMRLPVPAQPSRDCSLVRDPESELLNWAGSDFLSYKNCEKWWVVIIVLSH